MAKLLASYELLSFRPVTASGARDRCLQIWDDMRTITLALPRFGFIVATRAALLGVGIGLLVASRLSTKSAVPQDLA